MTIVKYSYAILTVCYALRLHVVEMKALFCSLFPLCTRLAIVCVWIDGQTTARRKLAPHLDIFRIHQLHEIFHDDVDTILVKVAVISEAEQIKLQAFALHHPHVGNV